MQMELTQWLDQEAGRLKRLADHFDLTPSAVSQWRGNGVPKDRMKALRDFTGNEVTLEDMIPEPSAKAA